MATTTAQLDLPGLRERVLNVLRGLLEELGSHGAIETLSVTSNLDRDLGLGSLERVELLTRLEAAFDVRLPDTLAAEANTAEELIEAIRKAPGAATVEDEESSAPRAALAAQRMQEQAAESIAERAETLVEVIRYRGIHDANRAHLIITEEDEQGERSQTLTFGELAAAAQKCAEELARRGVPAGGRVALMLPTSRQFFVCYAGILLAGAVPVPIYPPFRADRIEEYAERQSAILNNAGVCLLLTFRRAEAVAKLLKPRVKSLLDVVDAEKLLEAADNEPPPAPGALPAFISGSRVRKGARPCAVAIYVGFHGRSEGRDADAREPSGKHARHRESSGDGAERCGRELAAAVSRYGADRGVADVAAVRSAVGGDVTVGVPDAAGALAASGFEIQRNDRGGAEFCV